MTAIKQQKADWCLIDAIDNTQCALLKAQALIAMTFGEQGEAFRNLNDDYQDRFLWAISDLIDDAKSKVSEIQGAKAA